MVRGDAILRARAADSPHTVRVVDRRDLGAISARSRRELGAISA